MRRKDREVTDREEILEIMRGCDVCYVSLMDGEFPYIVPMNFGIQTDDGRLRLTFHCADTGRKLELLRQNPHAAFAMSTAHRLEMENGCHCTMRYASVCGKGVFRELEDGEKKAAMDALMAKYRPKSVYDGDPAALAKVTMLALEVEQVSAKRNQAKLER